MAMVLKLVVRPLTTDLLLPILARSGMANSHEHAIHRSERALARIVQAIVDELVCGFSKLFAVKFGFPLPP